MAKQKSISYGIYADTKHFIVGVKNSEEKIRSFRKHTQQATKTTDKFSGVLRGVANNAAVIHGPLGGISGRISSMATVMGNANIQMAAFGLTVSGLGYAFAQGAKQVVQAEHQMARLNGVLEATDHASGQTAESLDTMSRSIALATLASTDGVRNAAAQLATFTSITGENFERTLTLGQDVAEVMRSDISSGTMQLAKALADPTAGFSSLKKAGVDFTDSQKEMITTLQETEGIFEAQAYMLGLVEGQLGGVAEKVADGTFVGAWDTLTHRIGDFFAAIARGTGVVEETTSWMDKLSGKIEHLTGVIAPGTMSIEQLEEEMDALLKKTKELEQQAPDESFWRRFSGPNTRIQSDESRYAEELAAADRRYAALAAALAKALERQAEQEKVAQDAKIAAQEAEDIKAQARAIERAKETAKTIAKIEKMELASEGREAGAEGDPQGKAQAQHQARIAQMEAMRQKIIEDKEMTMEIENAFNALRLQYDEEFEAQRTMIEEKERDKRAKKWIKWADDQRKKEEEIFDAKVAMNDAYVNAVGSVMGTVADMFEEGSKAQKVALLGEKAAAIASTNLNIIAAMAKALNAEFPRNLVQYGMVATMGATLIGQLASAGNISGRASGGEVSPGGRYMVGEHGPEILQMGTGSGTIVKNEDIQPRLNVNIVEDPERGGQVEQEGENVNVFVQAAMAQLNDDLNSGRGLFASVENRYGLKR